MKVVKFGGSSMADAGQYRKIRDILLADPERKVVVVSAAGKRNKQDHKITDLLYLCYAHTQYGVDCSGVFEMITSRYREIARDLNLSIDLEPEFADLKAKLDNKTVTQDELASRGDTSPPGLWRTIWASNSWTRQTGSSSASTALWTRSPAMRLYAIRWTALVW